MIGVFASVNTCFPTLVQLPLIKRLPNQQVNDVIYRHKITACSNAAPVSNMSHFRFLSCVRGSGRTKTAGFKR